MAGTGRHWRTTDWTENLARQLSIDLWSQAGIHDTLMVVVPLLDDLLRAWPPPHTPTDCLPIAEVATRNLTPIEVYATFLAGPGRWRQKRVKDGVTMAGLATVLRPVLASELASELSRMLERWVAWDIRQLQDRWREAVKAKEAAERAEQAAAQANRPARKRRTPEEIAAPRGDNPVGTYQPKGRT